MTAVGPDVSLAALAAVAAELSDLKRVRVAGQRGTVAERLFARAWAALVAGEDEGVVAQRETATALAATRLAGVDAGVLKAGGLSAAEALDVLQAAVRDAAAGRVEGPALERLLDAVEPEPRQSGPTPAFIAALRAQPRAGATAPGRERVMLEPPESHADHCAIVAVIAVLLCPTTGADPGAVFLGALAHHLHNAQLPDGGFAGELALGPQLDILMARFTDDALAELPAPLQASVRARLGLNTHLEAPEARAVVAADVLDRVLQIRHHARAAGFTLEQALDELELVHPGPLQAYGEAVVAAAGLR